MAYPLTFDRFKMCIIGRIIFSVVFVSLVQAEETVCQPSEVLDIQTNRCLSKCSNDTYVFNDKCVTRCPRNTLKMETGFALFCYFENELLCDTTLCSKDFPLCYRMNCLKFCPEFTVEFDNKCVLQCPDQAPFMTSLECNGTCTNGRKICSKECPRTHPYIFTSKFMKQCLSECPNFTELLDDKRFCSLKCPPERPFLYKSSCFSKCPDVVPLISNIRSNYNSIYNCVELCPINTVMDEERCVKSCPNGKMLYNNSCVEVCPNSNRNMYANNLRKRSDILNFGHAEFMCVEDCNSEETRDHFGKHIYVSYKNICTSECPHSAYYEFNGYCMEQCPEAFSFIELQYNKKSCKNNCEHFVFNQSCHRYCPSYKMFVDNKTCVWECPSSKPYASHTYYQVGDVYHSVQVCTAVCPQFYSRERKGYCTTVCEDPFVIFNSSCIEECPSDYPYKETTSNGQICVDKCKEYRHENNCVSTCPNEAKYTLNMTCVNECSNPLPYKYQSTKKIKKYYSYDWSYRYKYVEVHEYNCVASCPLSQENDFNKTCVKYCPSNHNKIYNNKCLQRCPYYAKYMVNRYYKNLYTCVPNCREWHLISPNNECVYSCPSNAPFNYSGFCVSKCEPDRPYHFPVAPQRCLLSCPVDYYTHDNTKTCLKECLKDQFTYGDQCVNSCPDSYPINYTKNGVPNVIFTCVFECPPKSYELLGTCYDKCPDNTSGHEGQCVQTCPEKRPYRDEITGACVDICPGDLNLYRNEYCQKNCGVDASFIERGRCVEKCSTKDKFLVQKPQGTYCYEQCPENYIALNGSKWCHQKCPRNTMIFNNVCQHISECPLNTLLLDTKLGKKCTIACPRSHVINANDRTCSKECTRPLLKAGTMCKSKCPQDLPYKYQGRCYGICPEGYIGFESECIEKYNCEYFKYDNVCHKKCPSTTIKNSQDKTCQSSTVFLVLTVLFFVLSLTTLLFSFFLICFTGYDKSVNEKPSYENPAFDSLEEKGQEKSDDSSVV